MMAGDGLGSIVAVPGFPCKTGQQDPPRTKATSARQWPALAERIHPVETPRRGEMDVQGVPLHPQQPGSIRLKEKGGSG